MFESIRIQVAGMNHDQGLYRSTKRTHCVRFLSAGTACMIAVTLLGAAPAHAFCLDEAYQHAISSDPKYLQELAQYDAARQKYPQARAQVLPRVSATLEWGRYGTHSNLFGIDLSGSNNAAYGTAQLTQTLFNVPAVYDMSRAREFEESARQQLEVAKQDLILRVADACFDLLSAREKMLTADDEVQALARLEADARRLAQSGMKTISDVAAVEARKSLAQSDQALAAAEVETRSIHYEALLGSVIDFSKWPRLSMHGTSPRIPSAGYEPQDNPSYQQAYRDVRVAQLAVKRTRAEHLPVVNLFASYSRGLNPNLRGLSDASDFHQSAIGVQVTIPIFSGGSVYYKQAEAQHVRTQYQNRLREVEQNLSRDYHGTLSALELVGTRILALQQALQAARLAYDSSLKAHRAGYSTTYETLNLRADISSTRQKLFDTYLDTLKLQLKLKAILGSLDEQSLIAVNSFLDSNTVPAPSMIH